MRSAVIDLGSHSFHLLVADVDEHGVRRVVHDHTIVTRLGERAFTDGAIPLDAWQRGLAAFDELAARASALAPTCRTLATSVFRDTANGPAWLAEAAARTAMPIAAIHSDEEARLTWRAASTELAGSHGRLAVVDLGGGSLEVATGTASVENTVSAPLGVLRLRGRTPEAIRGAVLAELAGPLRVLRGERPDTVALTSGTARALLRLGRRLRLVAGRQRHMWWGTLAELAHTLATMSPAQLSKHGVDDARLDTIAVGAQVLHLALEPLRRPVVYVARTALREGALIELALEQRGRVPARAVPAH